MEDDEILDVPDFRTIKKRIIVKPAPLNKMIGYAISKETEPTTEIKGSLTIEIETKKKSNEFFKKFIPTKTEIKSTEPCLVCEEGSDDEQIEVVKIRVGSRTNLLKGLQKNVSDFKSQQAAIEEISLRTKETDLTPKNKKESNENQQKEQKDESDDPDYNPDEDNKIPNNEVNGSNTEENKNNLQIEDILQLEEGDMEEQDYAEDDEDGNEDDENEEDSDLSNEEIEDDEDKSLEMDVSPKTTQIDTTNKPDQKNSQAMDPLSCTTESKKSENISQIPNQSAKENSNPLNIHSSNMVVNPSQNELNKINAIQDAEEEGNPTPNTKHFKRLVSENIKKWYMQKLKEQHPSIKDIQNNKYLKSLFETEAELGSDNEDNDFTAKPIDRMDEEEREEGMDDEDEQIINNDEKDDFDHFEKYLTEALQKDNSDLAKVILREFKTKNRGNLMGDADHNLKDRLIEEAKHNLISKEGILRLLKNGEKEDYKLLDELDKDNLSDDAKVESIELSKFYDRRNETSLLHKRVICDSMENSSSLKMPLKPIMQSQFTFSKKIAESSTLLPKEKRLCSALYEDYSKKQKMVLLK